MVGSKPDTIAEMFVRPGVTAYSQLFIDIFFSVSNLNTRAGLSTEQ
jgi:hypothetical protein